MKTFTLEGHETVFYPRWKIKAETLGEAVEIYNTKLFDSGTKGVDTDNYVVEEI